MNKPQFRLVEEYWYRFEDRTYAPPLDEFDRPDGPAHTELILMKFLVVKVTPKGVWLHRPFGKNTFVRREARKRYACPTIDEARVSYRARKERQIGIHQAVVDKAERCLEMLNRSKYRLLDFT